MLAANIQVTASKNLTSGKVRQLNSLGAVIKAETQVRGSVDDSHDFHIIQSRT